MQNLGINFHITVSHLGVLDETTERFRALLILYGAGISGYFLSTAFYFYKFDRQRASMMGLIGTIAGLFIAAAGVYRYNLFPFEHNFFAFLYFSLTLFLMIMIGAAFKNNSRNYLYVSVGFVILMLFEMVLAILLHKFLFFSEMSFVGLFLVWAIITTIITGIHTVKLDKKSSNI